MQQLNKTVKKIIEKRESFSFFPMFALVILLPFFFDSQHLDPLVVSRITFLVLVNLLLFFEIYFVNPVKYRSGIFNNKSSVYLIVLFSVYVGMSIFSMRNSRVFSEGLLEASRLSQYLILLVLLTKYFSSETSIKIFLKLSQVLSILLIIVSLYQFIRLGEMQAENKALHYFFATYGGESVEAFFGNPNLYSFCLLLLIPFSVLFYFQEKSKKWRYLSVINLITLTLFLLYTFTVSAIIILFIGVFVSLLLYNYKFGIFSSRLTKLIYLVSLLGIVILYFTSPIKSGIEKIYQFETQEAIRQENIQTNVFERTLILKNTLEMIKDNPIFGVGLGDWRIEFQKYGVGGYSEINYGSQKYQRPHNDYLFILSESGFLALLPYLLVMILSLFFSWDIFVSSRNEESLSGLILFIGVLIYALISLFSYPKERVFITVLFIIYVSIITSISKSAGVNKKNGNKILSVFLLFGICGLFFVSSLWVSARYVKERHMFNAFHARLKSNWKSLGIETTRAMGKNILSMDPLGMPLNWYKATSLFHSGQIDKSLDFYKKAELENPYHINILSDIGSVYATKEDFVKAEEYYKKSLEITPLFGIARFNLAVIYYNSGEIDKAFNIIMNGNISILKNPSTKDPEYKLQNAVFVAIMRKKLESIIPNIKDQDLIKKLNKIMNIEIEILKLQSHWLQNMGKPEIDILNEY